MMNALNIRKCLVTGGAGFIGSHLVETLLSQGYEVRVLDNFSSGSHDNLLGCIDRIELIKGDIRDFETLRRACEGMDAVLHQAAVASVLQSVQEPHLTHDINVNGTLNVLEAARLAGVKKVNLASSAAVYGASEVLPKQEAMIVQPVSPYGLHKLMGEQYGAMYSTLYGLQVSCFRYFNVYGPRQDAKSQYSGVISIFLDRLLSGGTPKIYGDGRQSRDFIHVSDICQANVLALMTDLTFEVFNLGCGEGHTLLKTLAALQVQTGNRVQPEYLPERRGDLRHSTADISKTRQVLGFAPKKDFQAGLAELVEFTRAERGISASSEDLRISHHTLG